MMRCPASSARSLQPDAGLEKSREHGAFDGVTMSSIIITPAQSTDRQSFDWGELTWFANRSLGNQSELTVGRCVLKPGCENPLHYHPNCSEVLVVAQGTIEHTAPNGQVAVMQAGDVASIPPNVVHHARNIGTEDAIVWISFSSASRETVGHGVGRPPSSPLRVS
jgi:quercetin dioxygenase-like cupin family protein